MIIYCAADPIYFNHYFDLWAGQLNKFYPEHYKLVALYKPTKESFDKCNNYGVTSVDVTDLFPQNPTKEHFYLLRWLGLPYYKNNNILATQVNCLAVKKQIFPENIIHYFCNNSYLKQKQQNRIKLKYLIFLY